MFGVAKTVFMTINEHYVKFRIEENTTVWFFPMELNKCNADNCLNIIYQGALYKSYVIVGFYFNANIC